MCVIISKEKGIKLPTKDILKNCWERNPHGAGFMYNHKGKVIIKKGYMNFDDLYKELMKTDNEIQLKDKGLVIHFRIATSGLIDEGNCHPYPVSSTNNDLRNQSFVTDLGVAHNGIITYYNRKDDTLNDTQMFIKNDLNELYLLDNKFYLNPIFQSMVERLINGSRLIFLDGDGNIIKLGTWINENHLSFSNQSYLGRNELYNKYKQTFISFDESDDFIINGETVEQDDYLQMKDYLENIPFGKTIITKDGLDEYSWRDTNIYIDTVDKSIYDVSNHEISYIGEYS